MTIDNRIVNGRFEIGTLEPWIGFNASITTDKTHSGSFAALLAGGGINSFIYQFVPANFEENFELHFSISKTGELPSPRMVAIVEYFDAGFNFLGIGAFVEVPAGAIQFNEWLEEYQTTTPAPFGTTQALVLVNQLPSEGTAGIVVDNVELLAISPGPLSAFRASPDFSQFIRFPIGQFQQVRFTNEEFDTLREYSPTGSQFTPRTDGIYSICSGVGINPNLDIPQDRINVTLEVRVRPVSQVLFVSRAVLFQQSDLLLQSQVEISGCTILQLSEGDAVQIFIRIVGGVPSYTLDASSNRTYFAGAREA